MVDVFLTLHLKSLNPDPTVWEFSRNFLGMKY